MLKVLLVATVQSHICQFHKPLVEMLREQEDVEISVAAKDNLAEKNGLKLDFVDKVYDIPFSRSPKSKENLVAYKLLKEIIKKECFDIIHCNTPMGGILTRLAAKTYRKKGTKVFYTAHGFHFYKGSPKMNWLIYYPIEKFFSRFTDKVITINEEDYSIAKSKFKCEVERIHGAGVDPQRYYPVNEKEQRETKERLGLSTDKSYLLCVGELLPNKNQKMAIEAMSEVVKYKPDVVLLIAGNGPEKDNLTYLIDSLDLNDNVKLLGYLTNLELYQRVCMLSVSCSIREGLGINLIESMLSGNPVIATKNRGHNELITDGVNGYLVDCYNSKDMAEKMFSLLNDKIAMDRLSKNAYIFGKNYSTNRVKNELKRIYFGI